MGGWVGGWVGGWADAPTQECIWLRNPLLRTVPILCWCRVPVQGADKRKEEEERRELELREAARKRAEDKIKEKERRRKVGTGGGGEPGWHGLPRWWWLVWLQTGDTRAGS
jgi:hypothetical protein